MMSPRRFSRLAVRKLEDRTVPAQWAPDLQVLQSYLNGWTVNNLGGSNREIRFSTSAYNGGLGAFELDATSTFVTNPDGSTSILVEQKVYNSDKTSSMRQAGTFTYHPTHGHTHFDDFAVANLRLRPANQSVGDIVVFGPKTSFCLQDTAHFNPGLTNSPATAAYPGCDAVRQGISVGWNDVYGSSLDGQSINVSGVPNGDYWLEVTIDPVNHILETDEANNTTRVAITLTSLPTAGFRILSVSPSGALPAGLNYIDVNFNEAVDPTTFTPADIALTSPGLVPLNVTSITANSAVQYRLNFEAQAAVGTYNLTVGPNITATNGHKFDQNNNGVGNEAGDQYFNTMVISAPRINAATPTGGTYGPVTTARLTYNHALISSTLTTVDIVSFTGPGGVNLLGQITGVSPASTVGSSSIFDISFSGQTAVGTYSLVVSPDVADAAGNKADQNNDGIQNSVADRYTINFNITPIGTVGPDTFGYTGSLATLQNLEIDGKAGAFNIPLISGDTDDGYGTVDLKTNSLNFYGTSYTGASKLYVSTNGIITFGSGTTAYINNDLSTSTVASIAPLWDDWIPGTSTSQMMGYFEDADSNGTPERLIVQWNKNYHVSGTGSPVTFQVALQLNTGALPGKLLFNYADLDNANTAYNNGASATVAIRAAGAGASRLLVSYNSGTNPVVQTGKALLLDVPMVTSIVRAGSTNPAPDGDVDFLVTFNRAVTGVDMTDFTVTASGMTGTMVHGLATTADPAVFEVHVDTGVGTGAIRVNLIDDDTIRDANNARLGGLGAGNGSYTTGEIYNIYQRPPVVFGTTITNGASAQRSRFNTATVVFDHVVDFAGAPGNAFVLTGPGGPWTTLVDTSTSSPVTTVAKLTFTGAGLEGGSLPDGLFTLTIPSSQVSTAGVALDGDGNGAAGGDFTTTFRRKFGDADGDGDVDITDFTAFRNAFGTANTAIFDADGDNDVDNADFTSFRTRFGT